MTTPFEHALIGYMVSTVAKHFRINVNRRTFVISSVIPDLDFLLFAPWMGRAQGHRTITHAPMVQILVALFFFRRNFGSALAGLILHSLIDNFTIGKPPGVAWFWPFIRSRIYIGPRAEEKRRYLPEVMQLFSSLED